MQLFFQLHKEFIHHTQDDVFVQCGKLHGRVQTIAKFWAKRAFDFVRVVLRYGGFSKSQRVRLRGTCSCVGGHNQDDIAKIGDTSVVVGQSAMIHDLQ